MKIFKYKSGKALVVLALGLSILTACEKNFDYSVPPPPDGNTFRNDIDSSFRVLSAENKKWIWPVTIASNPFSNEGMGLIAEFRKDSTAYMQMVAKKTILAQFATLLASGKLDATQTAIVQAYNSSFAGLADWNLRNLIFNNPANATFLVNTQRVIPNVVNFNPILIGTAENGFNYNTNGPVQLSLTFTNTTLFPQLKQGRSLDYDFRITSFAPTKVELTGYYNNNSNKVSALYPTIPADITLFANGSNIFVPEGHLLVGNNSIKVNGTAIALPGTTSGLSLFYRLYKQQFISSVVKYGFSLVDKASTLPTELKSSEYYVVASAYTGNLATAPSGTVLVSLTGYNANGIADVKTVEFVKD